MTPYYDQDGITIYHGDCRDVLPSLTANVVITDPPYNVGKDYGSHDDAMPVPAYCSWLRAVLSLCAAAAPEVIFFPGTRNLLNAKDLLTPPLRPVRVLAWHKKEFAGDKWQGGPAMCWEPVIWASRQNRPAFRKRFGQSGRDCLVVNATHGDPFAKRHPCPKPLPVMQWLVGLFAPANGLVLDPFTGTGTTLRAAKDAGLRAIGIEIEERYCEIAARRLEQGVLALEES